MKLAFEQIIDRKHPKGKANPALQWNRKWILETKRKKKLLWGLNESSAKMKGGGCWYFAIYWTSDILIYTVSSFQNA